MGFKSKTFETLYLPSGVGKFKVHIQKLSVQL